MNDTSFINQVDQQIEKHHLLNHSFYQAWNSGALSNDTIREYAAQYFQLYPPSQDIYLLYIQIVTI